ncbi:hypothetical protein K443DRAFT_126730, partial [Laccaria amethystina LaAM-08-1]
MGQEGLTHDMISGDIPTGRTASSNGIACVFRNQLYSGHFVRLSKNNLGDYEVYDLPSPRITHALKKRGSVHNVDVFTERVSKDGHVWCGYSEVEEVVASPPYLPQQSVTIGLEEVPSILVQGPLTTSFLHDEPEFLSRVERWTSTLCTVEEDEFGILAALPILAFAFR